jgi:YidC/Oxa1 family membrane protein insertase
MFASIFEVLIVKPIFNLLVLIYALIPGHNFGVAIILFTIAIRFLMWPLVKKQLHHAREIRKLQPELKRIKRETKGDRQRESMLVMELYKERQISPFGSLGVLIIQLVILLGLYSGLRRVVADPQALIHYSYTWLHGLSWMKTLASDISRFDNTLFGLVDLTKPALLKGGGYYFPALVIVIGSAVAQYFQSVQLMPQDKEARSLRRILREAGEGKQADQSEVNAAIGRSTRYLLPVFILFVTMPLASALSLYWVVSGVTAYLQQAKILKQDEVELEAVADKAAEKDIIEGEVIPPTKTKTTKKKKPASKKRRKR